MRICFLSSAHPKFDKRVFQKEAVSLVETGFDVVHLAPDDAEEEEKVQGVTVHTYPRRSGLWGRFVQSLNLYRRAAKINADAYHANEVDSWIIAMALKLFRRKRVVFDVHEFYPSMLAESRAPAPLRPIARLSIRLLYRLLAPRTDAIVFANRYIAKDFKGINARYVMIENFIGRNVLAGMKILSSNDTSSDDDPIRIVHTGLIAQDRGSIVILDALKQLGDVNVCVDIIGKIVDMPAETYRAMAQEKGVADKLNFLDWMPVEDLRKHLANCHIGLILFQPNGDTNTYGLPHKLFDYLAAEIPVIASECSLYIGSILKEFDCGITVQSDDPTAVATGIRRLVEDEALRKKLGESASIAIDDGYNWETEAAKLTDLYTDLAKGS